MLSDKEILELNDLCNAVVDATLTETQRSRLSAWLEGSEDAREYYVRAMALSASLTHYASEMHADEPDRVAAPAGPGGWLWWLSPLAAAACVAVLFWAARPGKLNEPVAELKADEAVARLTASKECQWAGATPFSPGEILRRGQKLE